MGHETSQRELLEAAYSTLGYNEGEFISVQEEPATWTQEQWLEKGEWLSLAKQVGAEKIFFVKNNPVIIFATCEADETAAMRLFNRVWCMSRPALLYIAKPGELAVYSLSQPPVTSQVELAKRPFSIASNVAEVAQKFQEFRREQVESGNLFGDERFASLNHRADQLLINDLRTVRKGLMEAGLAGENLKYAHALIGRSIFIRYLEDRGILTDDYFKQAAKDNSHWLALLEQPLSLLSEDLEANNSQFVRVLSDHQFTYALFDKLAEDFNGDMFPSDSQEKTIVTASHLSTLQKFLIGDLASQQKLFLWAYKFDIVPVELISSIYEEFYHKEKSSDKNKAKSQDGKGTHYTPAALVDFVLSQVLTSERLEANPRILDPACGSGIFLVEAFRRIVRFNVHKRKGARLSAHELRNILRTQIAGIEINPEAVHVAAFSLYLALLHYQEPKDIIKQIEQRLRLPKLKYQKGQPQDDTHYNILLHANTFNVRLPAKGADNRLPFMDEATYPGFLDEQVDIVIGNPPWGESEDTQALKWCDARGFPVGDKESSQAFIWKTLDLLREGGYAGLLVSTGIFFKHHENSVAFRRKWLQSCELIEVVNFAHVRHVFFSAGNSPFATIVFKKQEKTGTESGHFVTYWSAKKIDQAISLQAVVLSNADRKLIAQADLLRDDNLWKIYWWGNNRDHSLISWLEFNKPLNSVMDSNGLPPLIGRGFEKREGGKASDWLSSYGVLSTNSLVRYGQSKSTNLGEVPAEVGRKGLRDIYDGLRILIKRGISQQDPMKKGQIIARLESVSFCFRNSIYGIKFKYLDDLQYKLLIGILWSSLVRYYYFLTCSTWGMWHHELHLEELARLPVRFPEDVKLRDRIVDVVDRLCVCNGNIMDLEQQLDEAIFDLYELNEPERDQVRDMCNVGIDFFYNGNKSDAVKPISATVHNENLSLFSDALTVQKEDSLQGYIEVFRDIWNYEAKDANAEWDWHKLQPGQDWPLIAVILRLRDKTEKPLKPAMSEAQEWAALLKRLDEYLLTPSGSKHIYIDGLARVFTESEIIVIKRNEKRFWTRSMAREDAEALMVQAINLQAARQTPGLLPPNATN